jgi:hypothetical protein
MERKGKYIYGILNSNASLHLSIPKDLFLGESESNGVYTIAYQDISALVRGSEIVDYTHMRKDILARLLIGHQTVIERVMTAQTTIIPMRLGIFAQDETEVRDILSKGYNLIKEIFERIKDKIEIDVACTWSDFNSIIKEAGEEREIKEFKERLLAEPKGITVDDQMKVGFMVKEALERKREVYSQEIQTALKSVSQAFKTHELMDDKMVVNIAFLIDKARREDFDKKVEELNAKFNEKLNFRCVGPLPPYSFYTLEIKIVKNEDVDWAKKKLGILNDITGKDELKKAYQRQVFSTHPDKNPNNPCAEKEFDEVNKAYKILADYCVALEQANPVRDKKSLNGTNQQDKVPFDREMFKENTMLVRVRE